MSDRPSLARVIRGSRFLLVAAGSALGVLAQPQLSRAAGAVPTPSQSAIDPAGEPARQITTLWWVMVVGGAIVLAFVVALLIAAYVRRHRRDTGERPERRALAVVIGGGLVAPLLLLSALFGFVITIIPATSAPARGSTALTVHVIGHQWFWEARYADGAVTANEIHIPAGRRVEAVVTTDDVIHSFWVPRLNRKLDLVPGRRNSLLLEADRPGVYRGQCSEFCGLQHAHMGFLVIAQPPAAFAAWLRRQAAPRVAPRTAVARRGERVFVTGTCASCHTVRGTAADGRVGPDLTHLASRRTIGALTLPNDPEHLARWVANPQAVKPGARMPASTLSAPDLRAVAAYLRELR